MLYVGLFGFVGALIALVCELRVLTYFDWFIACLVFNCLCFVGLTSWGS